MRFHLAGERDATFHQRRKCRHTRPGSGTYRVLNASNPGGFSQTLRFGKGRKIM